MNNSFMQNQQNYLYRNTLMSSSNQMIGNYMFKANFPNSMIMNITRPPTLNYAPTGTSVQPQIGVSSVPNYAINSPVVVCKYTSARIFDFIVMSCSHRLCYRKSMNNDRHLYLLYCLRI